VSNSKTEKGSCLDWKGLKLKSHEKARRGGGQARRPFPVGEHFKKKQNGFGVGLVKAGSAGDTSRGRKKGPHTSDKGLVENSSA